MAFSIVPIIFKIALVQGWKPAPKCNFYFSVQVHHPNGIKYTLSKNRSHYEGTLVKIFSGNGA